MGAVTVHVYQCVAMHSTDHRRIHTAAGESTSRWYVTTHWMFYSRTVAHAYYAMAFGFAGALTAETGNYCYRFCHFPFSMSS